MKKIVLVTGASKGIGESIAKTFLNDGDFVYVNYLTTTLNEVKDTFKDYQNVEFIKADVANEEEVKNMIDKIKKEKKALDVVVNNAGICMDSEVESKTKASFQRILDVNLIGPFLVCKYATKIMSKGVIINISSTNGIDTNYPYSLDYDASKAGLISLTRNLAIEYAPNIRVNTVAPGWVNTLMNKNLDEDYKKQECEHILLNRFAETEEIANVVKFLASDAASYINNSIIRVDGGLK